MSKELEAAKKLVEQAGYKVQKKDVLVTYTVRLSVGLLDDFRTRCRELGITSQGAITEAIRMWLHAKGNRSGEMSPSRNNK